MEINSGVNVEQSNLLANLVQREKQERLTTATLTTETLNRLSVSIEALPQKCQTLLHRTAELQTAMDVPQCDSHIISLRQTIEAAQMLDTEYEILQLRTKNQELQQQINANNKFIEDLKSDLESSRQSLTKKSPNPENISEHIHQMKQKLATFEEAHEKVTVKYSMLKLPEGVLPTTLQETARHLAELKAEEAALQERADDITLARRALRTLHQLRG